MQKQEALDKIKSLVERFDEQKEFYKNKDYNETQTRRDFIDPFWKALGWDIDNENGYAESYREVIHEDRVKVGGATKAPDYSFRLVGGKRLFFLEAKKPSVLLKDDIAPAYQVRRYGWSAKMPISVITDFEEFAIYDCTTKPKPTDKASNGRIKYLTYSDYITEFDFIWDTFAKERVLKGSFDKYITSDKNKKGTSTVDNEFLQSLDKWREELAVNIALRNKNISEDELNFVVQHTIDRIIFLRIAEDRSVEPYGTLLSDVSSPLGRLGGAGDFYQNLLFRFHQADQKYNSGLFDFEKDKISGEISIDNKVLKNIISELYYPICPYEFSVLSVEILGSAYEQFLGKQITLTAGGRARIEEKPEVRKAGGVYYTPQYIVDYIVKNTINPLLSPKGGKSATPADVAKLKICDPACGSGSFLIGAYQFLLDWHKDYYNAVVEQSRNNTQNGASTGSASAIAKGRKNDVLTPNGELTTAEKKRILLNNIYGVDLDSNAVEVTKLSLLLKCMEGETKETIEAQTKLFHDRILPTLDNNIKSGNSLIDLDYYDNELDFGEERKVKPFSWQKAFPEVFERTGEVNEKEKLSSLAQKAKHHAQKAMEYATELEEKIGKVYDPKLQYGEQGGFDVIIGNPPYGASFNEIEKKYFTKKYKVSEGNFESFSFFIERASAILKQSGYLGYIIPDTWFTIKSAYKLRKFILEEYRIDEIQMLNEKVFKSAKVDVCTFVLSKEKNDTIFNVFVYDKDADEIEISQGKYIDKNQFTKVEILKDVELGFRFKQSTTTKELIAKISKQPFTLDNFCLTVTGCKPYQVGKGVPKQTKQMLDGKVYTATKKKDKTYRRMLRGGDISRYSVTKRDDEWLSYGEWLAEQRLPQVFESPRLLFQSIRNPKLKRRLVGTYVDDDTVNNNSITNVILKDETTSLKFFLAILNSDLMNWYFSVSYNIVNIDPRYLKMIPIVDFKVNQKNVNEIIKYVEQLLKLNADKQNATLPNQLEMIENRIDHAESKINELVYQLYELTEEEIRLIEAK